MGLRLAGEEYSVVRGLDILGWLRQIAVNSSTPALTVTQNGSGPGLRLVGLGVIPSGQTGWHLYNTVDEATNYERVRLGWSGNKFYLGTQKGGSGAARPMQVGPDGNASSLVLAGSAVYFHTNEGMWIAGDIGELGTTGAMRIRTTGAGQQLTIYPKGGTVMRGDQNGSTSVEARAYDPTSLPLLVKGAASQSQDLVQIVDSAGALHSKFDKNGYFMTRKTAFPADGDLVAGELALWFDSTAGAAKLKIKAKNASGTVVAGEVALN